MADMELSGFPSINLSSSLWRANLATFILERGFRIVYLDNIMSLFPGIAENDTEAWSPVNQWLLKLRARRVSVILAHHSTKDGRSSRGTGQRIANLTFSIKVRRDDGCHDGDLIMISYEKARLSPDKKKPFTIKFKQNEQGIYSWENSCLAVRSDDNSLRREVIARTVAKESPTEIQKAGVCARRYVYAVLKWGKAEGILDDDKRLTDKGRRFLNDEPDDE